MTDKEIIKRMREIESRKAHQCAEYLKSKRYFTSIELSNALREYGVARSYFEQLYHLEWKYEWIKKCTMPFERFLEDIVSQASMDIVFDRERISYEKEYRINGNCIDKYEQEYVYCIAFRKKDMIS